MKLFHLLAAASAVATAAVASPVAGGSSMPALPKAVLDDLARRDPSEYTIFSQQNGTGAGLAKRGPPNGLTGVQSRCTKSRCLSYTFDDGPYNDNRKIVDQAVKDGIKVTFFVNVLNYDCIYNKKRVAELRYAYSKGMQICSHTATHPHLNSLSHSQIDTQVEAVETALYKIIGAVPSCIRPPFGEANADVVSYLNNKHGLVVVNWNFDSGDSTGSSVKQSQSVLRGIKSPKHAIILMHETEASTANSLFPSAFGIAKSNGYSASNVYTVPDGLGFNGYKVVGKQGTRDSSWTCNGLKAGQ